MIFGIDGNAGNDEGVENTQDETRYLVLIGLGTDWELVPLDR